MYGTLVAPLVGVRGHMDIRMDRNVHVPSYTRLGWIELIQKQGSSRHLELGVRLGGRRTAAAGRQRVHARVELCAAGTMDDGGTVHWSSSYLLGTAHYLHSLAQVNIKCVPSGPTPFLKK